MYICMIFIYDADIQTRILIHICQNHENSIQKIIMKSLEEIFNRESRKHLRKPVYQTNPKRRHNNNEQSNCARGGSDCDSR